MIPFLYRRVAATTTQRHNDTTTTTTTMADFATVSNEKEILVFDASFSSAASAESAAWTKMATTLLVSASIHSSPGLFHDASALCHGFFGSIDDGHLGIQVQQQQSIFTRMAQLYVTH